MIRLPCSTNRRNIQLWRERCIYIITFWIKLNLLNLFQFFPVLNQYFFPFIIVSYDNMDQWMRKLLGFGLLKILLYTCTLLVLSNLLMKTNHIRKKKKITEKNVLKVMISYTNCARSCKMIRGSKQLLIWFHVRNFQFVPSWNSQLYS